MTFDWRKFGFRSFSEFSSRCVMDPQTATPRCCFVAVNGGFPGVVVCA